MQALDGAGINQTRILSEQETTIPTAWAKLGKFVCYNLQEDIKLPPRSVAYIRSDSLGRLNLTGAPSQVNWIVKSEFPDSVSDDFLNKHLIQLITGFGSLEKVVHINEDGEDSLEQANDSIRKNAVLAKKFINLFADPIVKISDDGTWTLFYNSLSGKGELSLTIVEGKKSPFLISKLSKHLISIKEARDITIDSMETSIKIREKALIQEKTN